VSRTRPAVRVGDVVRGEHRVPDAAQTVVVVVVLDGLLLGGQVGCDLLDQVAGQIVDGHGPACVGTVHRGATAEVVVRHRGGVVVILNNGGTLGDRVAAIAA